MGSMGEDLAKDLKVNVGVPYRARHVREGGASNRAPREPQRLPGEPIGALAGGLLDVAEFLQAVENPECGALYQVDS